MHVEVPDQKGGSLIINFMCHELVKGMASLWDFVVDVDDPYGNRVAVVYIEDNSVGTGSRVGVEVLHYGSQRTSGVG